MCGVLLGQPRVHGTFAIEPTSGPGMPLAFVPADAMSPAELSIQNLSTTATVRLLWIKKGENRDRVNRDASLILYPQDSHDFRTIPGGDPNGSELVAVSSVANSLVALAGSWAQEGEQVR